MENEISFSREEVSKIEKNLGFIVFDWAKHLISHIIYMSKNANVEKLYMNTPTTLDAGAVTEGKVDYFYTRLPPLMGFKLAKANLRNRGQENLWVIDFTNTTNALSLSFFKKLSQNQQNQKTFSIEQISQIDPKLVGLFFSLFGKKKQYTESEVRNAIAVKSKSSSKESQNKKSIPKYFYDWSSKSWSGSQRFSNKVTETVVLQKLPKETQEFISNDPTLTKFWAFILSKFQHFGPDVIGFALVSKLNTKTWLINEIQTDCVNAWNQIRRLDTSQDSKENTMSWETLSDMLTAQNKSNWIPKLQNNPQFKEHLLAHPGEIQQLPDNSVDIDKWINDRQTEMAQQGIGTQGLDLIRHYQNSDFNRKVFLIS